ncbi:MAG TPA: heavy metal-binding domain-containing protein [Beijerinckia sp.]|nr:heavy metal-binding domain-containing protein [Beijerinckia sp.]
MRVIFESETGGLNAVAIGKIQAASNWHGPSAAANDDYKAKALRELINAAQEYDADAITGIDYTVERVEAGDTPGSAPLQRICATGVAVKLARS